MRIFEWGKHKDKKAEEKDSLARVDATASAAVQALGAEVTIDHVTDFGRIASYGVMTTPALVLDGKVVAYGKVLKREEIIQLIRDARQ